MTRIERRDAERAVDELLGERMQELLAAERERDAMRPVVEAARAYVKAWHGLNRDALIAAVDALDGAS